jgi:hypothetical protein
MVLSTCSSLEIIMDSKEIAQAVVEALESRRHISQEDHDLQHDYIKMQMNKESRRQEIWEAVKVHLAKYGAVAILTGLGIAVWNYLKIKMN